MTAYVPTGPFVNVANYTTAAQLLTGATRLADGTLVLVWHTLDTTQDGSAMAVKMRLFSPAGVPLGNEILVNTHMGADQAHPEVTALAGGGFVVAWYSSSSPDGVEYTGGIEAQVFTATGAKVGSEFRVNTAINGVQEYPVTAGLADGGFVVVWQTRDATQDGSGSAIKAQAYSAAGLAVGGEFLVNTSAAGNQLKPEVAGLADGGFVVTWHTGNDANSEIYAQRYAADGAAVGGEILVSQDLGRQTDARVAALGDGGFVVTWMSNNLAEWSSSQIRAQIFDAAGNKAGAEFTVNSSPAGSQMLPDVVAMDNGTIAFSWGEPGGHKVRVFDAAGQPLGLETTVSTASVGYNALGGELVATASGLAFAWSPSLTVDRDPRLQLLALNTAPELGNATRAVSAPENGVTVLTLTSTDDGGPLARSYSIVGGADAAMFSVSASTGVLRFVSPHNFEAPNDADLNNAYEVVVQVSDGDLVDTQAITVTVANVGEAPVFTSPTALAVGENALTVGTVAAYDQDLGTITYSIAGGADYSRFTINAQTGVLSFKAAPNYEAPGDADGNNVYQVTIAATGRLVIGFQTHTITVGNVDEAPVITSNGGGATASLAVVENATAVTTVTATDPDGSPRSYTIASGADAALFTIDAVTGALAFAATPNFEAPADANGDNVYQVVVGASDGSLLDTQTLSITVTNANEAPAITSSGGGSSASIAADENAVAVATVVASDPEGGASYAIAGGADAALFAIDTETGALTFVAAPDFETPADADHDNVYEVIVAASDGSLSDTQALSVAIADVAENPPLALAATAFEVDENTSASAWLAVTGGAGVGPVHYAITGGADAAQFWFDEQTGELELKPWDFEEPPLDHDGDNVYEVEITAEQGADSVTGLVTVTLRDVDEAPVFLPPVGFLSVTVGENVIEAAALTAFDPEGHAVSFALLDVLDYELFSIDPQTGVLSFLAPPDFEAPADRAGNNVYELGIAVSDGEQVSYGTVEIHVTDVAETLTFAETAFETRENELAVAMLSASGDPATTAYAITGGADAALFALDAATGALRFLAASDFEAPADADGDNVYEVIVSATDGTSSGTQTIAVAIGNIDEDPSITSAPAVSVVENETAVAIVAATDPEGAALEFRIAGGADAALFALDAATGALRFLVAPDFEAPGDADGDNLYEVVVSAGDGSLGDTQALTVAVLDVPGPAVDGTAAGNNLAGGAEEDTLRGMAGNDRLSGLDGDDTLEGGDGADRLAGGAGNDTMAGGAGDDTYYVDTAGDLVVELAGEGFDVVRAQIDYALTDNVEELFVGGAARNGTGNALANTLHGSGSNNTLRGLAGDDVIRGLGGRDTIDGGEGEDLLDGGVGKDTLTGGAGRDAFQFRDGDFGTTRALADVITDFSQADREKIQLNLVDANTALGGDQAFAWIGTGAFTGAAGQLRYVHQAGNTYVEGDTDGDGTLDFAIMLTGAVTLTSVDFTL